MVVVLVVMLISFKFTFPAAQPEVSFETYKSSVSVEAPSLSFSKDGEREFFAVVGMLKNASDIEWRSPYVEAKFLNAKGDLIDTMSSNLKDVILLPQSSAAFRITGYTARPSSEYAKVEISVTSARSKAKWE